MLINVELNQLEKQLRELKTHEEKINQVEDWLKNNNITVKEYDSLIKYATPVI